MTTSQEARAKKIHAASANANSSVIVYVLRKTWKLFFTSYCKPLLMMKKERKKHHYLIANTMRTTAEFSAESIGDNILGFLLTRTVCYKPHTTKA
jgi:hypothetical protein